MSILDKKLIITMPSGEKWSVPVRFIVTNRASHFKSEHGNDFSKSRGAAITHFENSGNVESWARSIPWVELTRLGTLINRADYDHEVMIGAEMEIIDASPKIKESKND